jgi:hypothetical protein
LPALQQELAMLRSQQEDAAQLLLTHHAALSGPVTPPGEPAEAPEPVQPPQAAPAGPMAGTPAPAQPANAGPMAGME